jgi:hypothetical protein
VELDDHCGPQTQQIERTGGTWSMRTPRGMRVGTSLVDDILETLANTKAEAWVAEQDDGTFGLTGTRACAVGLSVDDGNASVGRTSLTFGDDAPHGVYARSGDDSAVFVIGRAVKDALASPLIDPSALHIDIETSASIRVTRRGERSSFEHIGPDIVAVGTTADVVASSSGGPNEIGRALAALHPIAASHFGAPARDEGFGAPTLEIEIVPRHDAGAGGEARIAFGAKVRYRDVDAYLARTAAVDATFVVRAAEVDAVLGFLPPIPGPARTGETDSEPPK